MADVIDLAERRADLSEHRSSAIEASDFHLAGDAKCGACGYIWVAVAPVGSTHLDCPGCGRLWGTFQHPIVPEVTWACGCGERLFWITARGVMCRMCGEIQEGFD